jgi:thiol-disulfide isomerase/thioredoxin
MLLFFTVIGNSQKFTFDRLFQLEIQQCNKQVKQIKSKSKDPVDYFSSFESCMKGKYFHDIMLEDINGKKITNNEFKDHLIIVNYWFIGCAPCVEEKCYLQIIANKYKKIKILSISKDSKIDVQNYIKKNGLDKNWIYIHDHSRQNTFQNTLGYPLTILMRSNGEILSFLIGGIQNEEKYKAFERVIDSIY